MLELVPISNDNSCTACGHTRKASEAFIIESACPGYMANNKVYPATSGYRKRKNLAERNRKRPKKSLKPPASSITGQQLLSWLGGIALILTIAIGFKSFQSDSRSQTPIKTASLYFR